MSQPQPSDQQPSDVTLLRRLRSGEADAATELYVRYARRLHGLARQQTSARLARRINPDEIVQSVFRTFFRRAPQSDYEIPAGEELWRLLLVITLNKIRSAAKYHQAQRRDVGRTSSLDAVGIGEYLASARCHDESAVHVLQLVIDDLLEKLPESRRQMIRLRIDGCELDEIASRTRYSKRTVERTLQEFRGRLSSALDEASP